MKLDLQYLILKRAAQTIRHLAPGLLAIFAAFLFCDTANSLYAQANGIVYATGITGGSLNLYAINQADGTTTIVYTNYAGTLSAAMAQRPTDGMIFFISGQNGNDSVYKWNPLTPATAPVLLGTTGNSVPYCPRMACSTNGTIYAMPENASTLYTINATNGTATSAATYNNTIGDEGGDMVFATNGTLYMFASTNLYTVPLAGGTIITNGPITGGLGTSFPGAAWDNYNRLVLIDNNTDASYYWLDPSTRVATQIGATGAVGTSIGDLASVPVFEANLAIGKSAPSSVVVASNFTYTISVTNLGPSPATSIVVTDALPTGVTFVSASSGGTTNARVVKWSLGQMDPDEETNLTLIVTAPASGTTLTNKASVTSGTVDTNLANNTSPQVITTVAPAADLAVGKTGPTSVYEGTNFSYTITVTNLGPSSATGVVVTDALPVGVTFVSASGGGATNAVNPGNVSWVLGTMTFGQKSNLTLTVSAPVNGTTLTNKAIVSSGALDPNLANNTSPSVITTVTPIVNLAVGKTGPATVFAGTNFSYTITVTNFGPSSASGVVVTDALPLGVTFISASGGGTTNAGIVTWSLGTMTFGQKSNLTLTVTAPVNGTTLTNKATVGSGTLDTNTVNNTSPTVLTTVTPVVNLAVGKTGPATVFAGTNFSYTITVTNFGPSSASGVVVTDALPLGVTFISASGGGVTNNGIATWSLGTMTTGQKSNLTLTVSAPVNGTTLTNKATVGSGTLDTNTVNNTSPTVLTTVTPVVNLAVGKTGPATVFAGTNFSYTITVTNFGPSSASGVVVTDALPLGVTFISASGGGTTNAGVATWSLGTMTSGQTSNLTLTVSAPVNGTTLTNKAIVGSGTLDTNTVNNTSPTVLTTVTPVADLAVGKSGPAGVLSGTNFSYTITVTNFGPSSASGVVVTDALPLGVTFISASGGGTTSAGVATWSLGTMTTGQTSNLTLTVSAPVNGTTLTNKAIVGSGTLDTNTVNNTSPTVLTTVTPVADLAVGKSGPAGVLSGTNFSYTITVTNFGPSSASGVVVTDALPLGVTFISASGGGTTNAGVATWSLGTMTSGQTSNLTLTVSAPVNGTTLTNKAIVGSGTLDTNTVNNTSPTVLTTVTPIVNLAVGKTGPATVFAGTNFSYTITVTNFGPSSASGVVVTDALPLGVTFISASGGGTTNAGVATWSLGTMTSGQTSNLTLTVSAPVNGTTLTNKAIVGSGTLDTNTVNNTSPTVLTTVTPVADLAVGKSGPAGVLSGTNFSYTITVTNFGPSSASGVVVTDALPLGVTFISASDGGVTNNGIATWSLGTMTAGAVSNLILTVSAPVNGTTLTNKATVGSGTLDTNTVNNTSPTVLTTVTPAADLAVGKSGPGGVLVGTSFSYTISVTNFGPSSASGVVVTDALPLGVTFISASGGGVTNNGIATWSLGTVTAGEVSNLTLTVVAPAIGSITNIASATSGTLDTNLINNTSPPVITAVTSVADLAVGKSGPPGVLAGTNFSYMITVTNFGPSSASGVVVTDALPLGVTFVSASGGGTTNAGVVAWSLGTVTLGEVSNLILTVTAPAIGTTLTNMASVSSGTLDTNLVNNTSPMVMTTVTPAADLAIGKSGPAGTVYGNNFNYTISVTNFGPSVALDLSVTDSLPAGLVFVSSVPVTTTNASNQVIWTNLGSLISGATTNLALTVNTITSGTVSNFASVGGPTLDPNLTNNVTPPVVTIISKALPIVTWATPTNIVYGTVLDTNENNATATVDGTYVYSPTNGVVLDVGTNTLTVLFTPTDTNYVATNLTVELVVTPAPLTLTAGNQSKMFGATLDLGTTNFVASGLVNGDIVTGVTLTSAGSGSGAAMGTYPIVPSAAVGTDLTNYTITYDNGTLNVGLGVYSATWATPTNIVYGTVLDTNENNATATIDGTYVYSPTNGVVLDVGTNTLAVLFTPTDTNYAATNLTVELVVTPAPLTLTAGDQGKMYGTTLDLGTTNFVASGLVNGDTVTGVTLTSAGSGSGAPVGTYPIVPSAAVGTDLTNYTITYDNGTLSVGLGVYSATWATPTNIVYGTPLGTNQNDATATIGGTFTYNPTNGVVLPAGTNTLTVLFTPTDTNYASTNLTVQLVVTPAPLTVTAGDQGKMYGTTLDLGTTNFVASGLVNGDTVTSVTLTSAGAGNGAAVGTYPIIPSAAVGSGLSNYTITYDNGTLSVGLGVYSATWATPTNIVYGTPLGTNQNNATATIDGTYVYSPTNGVVLDVGTNTLAVLFTPTDTNYAATNLTVELVVTPAPLTLTAGDQGKMYGTTLDLGTTNFVASGLVNGDTVTSVTLISAGSGSGAPVGSYPIIPSAAVGSGLSNYTITYDNGTLSVGLGVYSATWATPPNIVYGTPLGTNQNDATATIDGTFTYNPTNGVVLPAGTNTLTVLFTPTDTNYASTNLSVLLVVTPAPLTLTAGDQGKMYGTTLDLGTTNFTASGLVNGDTVTGVTLTSAGSGSGAPVGTYPIVPSAAVGTDLTNYTITYDNGTLNVGLGVYSAAWATPTNIVYGTVLDTNENNATATIGGTYVYSPTNGVVLDVGTNTLTVLFTPTDTNYASTNLTVELVVTPAPLTLTAGDQGKMYGTTLDLGTTNFVASGLVNGDTVTGVTLTSAGSGSGAPVGTYPIVPSAAVGTDLTNYTITYDNGTLNVGLGVYSATWATPTNIVYGTVLDTNENNATATIDGTFTYNPTNGVVLPAGTNTLTVFFTPTDTNYASTNLTVELVVTPAPLTLTAGDQGKMYGTTLDLGTTNFVANGLVNGDTVTGVTLTSAGSGSGAPVGTYPIIPSAAVGSDLTNYTITYDNGTLSVGLGVYSATWATPTNIVYGTVLDTNENNATATIDGTFTYNPTNGVVLPVGTNTLTVLFTPTDTNYASTNLTVELVVTPAPLTLTAGDQGKMYGTTLDLGTTNFVAGGLVNGDTVTGVTLTSAGSGSGAPVGTYPIVPSAAVGSGLSNYTITYDNGTLNVGLGVYSAAWATPTNIVYGTVLDTNENNATATIDGTFTYNPTNGVVLDVGTNTLAVIFTPTDTNYAATNLTVELVVTPAPLTLTAGDQGKMYGTTLDLGTTNFVASGLVNGDTVTGVTLTSAGSGSGAPVGAYPIVPSAAVGTDLTNYTITYDNGTLSVGLGVYSAAWATPTNIVYGTVLDTNENNATATIDGTFTYNPTNGVVLPVGTNTLTVLFTPTDTNYVATNLTVELVVTPAPLTLTAGDQGKMYGTTLNLGTTNFTASGLVNGDAVTGVTLTSAGSGSGAAAGNYPIVPSAAVGSGLTNYTITYSNGTLSVIALADLAVGKSGPASVVAGTNFNYTIMVTNFGPSSANGVVVTDALPAGVTFISATGGGTTNAGVATWSLGTMTSGQKSNLTLTVSAPLNGTTLTNVAIVSSSTLDTNTVNNMSPPVTTIVTSVADLAVGKSGPAGVPAGTNFSYTITVTNFGPSSASGVVVTDALPAGVDFIIASGDGSDSSGIVTWSLGTMTAGEVSNLTVTVTAPGITTTITNRASVGSGTLDTNSINNTSAPVTTTVTAAGASADIQVYLYGPTNVTVGDEFSYTVEITNAGPSAAANTLAQDMLPTNLVFTSASDGGTISNHVVSWPVIALLANGQATNLTVNVSPSTLASTNHVGTTSNPYDFISTNTTVISGLITNIASAYSSTYDPDLTNNNGTLPSEQVQTRIVPGVFSILLNTNTYPSGTPVTNTVTPIGGNLFVVGTGAFDPQTGFFEESVTVTNIGTAVVHSLRLYIGGLRSGVSIYNATGTNNGVPYVEYDPPYDSPLLPYPEYTNGSSVTFVLEFYVANRSAFTNSLTAVAIVPPTNVTMPAGTTITSTISEDQRNSTDTRYLIEFNSIPGRTYTIEYSDDDMVTWNIATPSIIASANVTQWYDDGPPETDSKPTSLSSRYYMVILEP